MPSLHYFYQTHLSYLSHQPDHNFGGLSPCLCMRAGTRILLYGRAVVVGLPSWWGWPRCAAHVEGPGVDGRDTVLRSPEHAGGQPHRLLSSSDVRLTARGERHGLNLGRGNLHVTGRDRHGDYARAPPPYFVVISRTTAWSRPTVLTSTGKRQVKTLLSGTWTLHQHQD